MTMRRIDLQPLEPFTSDFIDRTGAFNPGALEAATAIIEQVRRDGDAALRALTEKFDGVAIENFRVPGEAIDAAMAEVDLDTLEALKHAAAQIRDFHERQKQQSWFFAREDGAIVGSKVTPLESVGIYVPGGRALYPSTVLMNALPAQVAGVERIVCVTPPTKDGTLDAAILAACKIAGVTEIYTVGGAQAVAALAYGTETIRPVAKITGPGTAFVAAAGRCGHRYDRRAVGGLRRGRRDGRPAAGGHRSHGPGRARSFGGLLPRHLLGRLCRRGGGGHPGAPGRFHPRRHHPHLP